MNVNALFEERYGGKTPSEFNDEENMFTGIEMVNFAKHCIDKKAKSSITDIRLLKILHDLKDGRITVTACFNQIKGTTK